jgi:hypothetical protein
VKSSPSGLPLSSAELSEFARNTRQVVDGLFVATTPGRPSPQRADDDAHILDLSLAMLAAWDSTYWLVSAPDAWLGQFRQAFSAVHDEDLSRTPLRAWGPTPS